MCNGGRGRPFGGIESHVTGPLELSLILKTETIVAVNIRGAYIAGCYFKPTLDLDDITNDLSLFHGKVNNQGKVFIPGDFNIKPQSQEFQELTKFLLQFNIVIRSDTSCLDHIFYRSPGLWSHYQYMTCVFLIINQLVRWFGFLVER